MGSQPRVLMDNPVFKQESEASVGIVIGDNSDSDAVSISSTSSTSISIISSSLYPTCRICFQDLVDPDNPLISPCRCSGSIGYVHRKCLRKWIEVNYAVDFPKCEICHFPYKRGSTDFNFTQLRLPSCSRKEKILTFIFFISIGSIIGIISLMPLFSESMNEAGGDGNLTNELLCFASLIVIFIALFAAIVTQTITSFSFLQYFWKILLSSKNINIEEYDKEKDGDI